MPYRLYENDNTTPVAVPQAINATFNPAARESFNDGGVRRSALFVVEWRFKQPLSDADFGLLTLWTPESGRVRFDTLRPRRGATASAFVACEGTQAEVGGTQLDGADWYNVYVKFVAVRVL